MEASERGRGMRSILGAMSSLIRSILGAINSLSNIAGNRGSGDGGDTQLCGRRLLDPHSPGGCGPYTLRPEP